MLLLLLALLVLLPLLLVLLLRLLLLLLLPPLLPLGSHFRFVSSVSSGFAFSLCVFGKLWVRIFSSCFR